MLGLLRNRHPGGRLGTLAHRPGVPQPQKGKVNMSSIANIRTLVESLPDHKQNDPVEFRRPNFKAAVAKAAKLGFGVHNDGRCYVPEANRGRGIGYGRHGK
jgi:hypothetical protein